MVDISKNAGLHIDLALLPAIMPHFCTVILSFFFEAY